MRYLRVFGLLLLVTAAAFSQSPGSAVITYAGTCGSQPCGATPTFTSTADYTVFVVTLTQNITSSTYSTPANPSKGAMVICQNGTGGYTFALPSSFKGFQTIGAAANACVYQEWYWDGTNVNALFTPQGQEYGTGAGTAQSQTVTVSAYTPALVKGLSVKWLPNAANTAAAPTLAVNTLTATAITKCGTAALVPSDIITTAAAWAIYDGTQFELLNPATGCGVAYSYVVTATTFNFVASGYYFNQYGTPATAVTGTLPTSPVTGEQYCFTNSNESGTADTGVLRFSIGSSSTTIEYKGALSTSGTSGYASSTGAAGDSACVVAITTTSWELYPQLGTWAVH